MRSICSFAAAAVLLLLAASATFGQGSLTPPDAPAPTMRTLDQVEPRVPVAGGTATINILVEGSYYLTGNVAVTTGSGIVISAPNATLDLNGYSVSSTASSPGSSDGINFTGTGSVVIRNGRVRGTTTVNTSTGAVTPGGFYDGVSIGGNATSARIESLEVLGVADSGIVTVSATAQVSHCQANITGYAGINVRVGSVDHCQAARCDGPAITGTEVSDCDGSSLLDEGVVATYSVVNSRGASLNLNASTNYFGVHGGSVTNCQGTGTGGSGGISGDQVINSKGDSLGIGSGISAVQVSNSEGDSVAGTGLFCTTATNCKGLTNGTTASTYGLNCEVATGCCGSAGAAAAPSIKAKIANGCSFGPGGTAVTHNVNSF